MLLPVPLYVELLGDNMKNIGLYIHIPFCNGKCPYCDFYSIKNNEDYIDEYVLNLNKRISSYKGQFTADTIYFGGGTPSLLGTKRIVSVLENIHRSFGTQSMESTIEVNPESAGKLDFKVLSSYGINRISIGMQSANENELLSLGRKHSAYDVKKAVDAVRSGGIDNISLDLMIGLIAQIQESLERSIIFCSDLDVSHISSYILKVEKGTLYYKNKDKICFPDEDTVCDLYEYMVQRLSELGYNQYEISNFSKTQAESRHNMKYWNCEEYLGIGSSAHSFIDGKRFFYGRSISDFYSNKIIQDGTGGDVEEYIEMRLRLSEGLNYKKFEERFGYRLPKGYIQKAERLKNSGLLNIDGESIRLTPKGFLCSNAVIVEIIS